MTRPTTSSVAQPHVYCLEHDDCNRKIAVVDRCLKKRQEVVGTALAVPRARLSDSWMTV
jgi:hypothetical protein